MAKVAQKQTNKKTGKYSDIGSGKPGPGRPKGSRNKKTLLLQKLAEGDAEQILKAMIKKAKAGDVDCCKFILSRLLPPAKTLPVEVNLDGKKGLAAIDEVIHQTAKGAITPEAALALTQIMERRENIYAVSELEQRITLLESGAPVIGIGGENDVSSKFN